MKKKYMELWVKALNSGKFKQGEGALKKKVSGSNVAEFCCLGVLCDIVQKEVGGEWIGANGNSEAFATQLDERGDFLPAEVMDLVGMKSEDGEYTGVVIGPNEDEILSLASLNDSHYSFKEIAKIIKRKWRSL